MKKRLSSLLLRFRQPKWRHGKLGALLVAGFLAICVLVNVFVQALEDEYGWRTDLSFNAYATTGEQTRAVLDRLENDVDLYLLYQSGAEDTQLLQLLNRYAVLSDRVTVKETDIAQNPGILTRFPGDTDKTAQADSVIVSCDATGRYKILDYTDFLTQGYDIESGTFQPEGLSYEKSLTEAIASVAQTDPPTVGVLQGHGELTPDALELLLSFLESNGYDHVTVDLSAEGALTDVALLLIASPQKDFSDTELEEINEFAKEGGSLFITRDYTDPLDSMPNYLSLLRSYGVTPLSGIVVDPGAYHENPLAIVPYMEELDMTQSLISSGMDVLLMPAACAFETPGEPDHSLTTGTVLKTSDQAYLRDLSDGTDSVDQQPCDRSGELSVALYAHRMHANGNISRLFIAGSSGLFTEEYVYQRTYVQQFIIMLMGQLLSDKIVTLDIMASAAVRPALTVGSQTVGTVLIIAVPLMVLVAGLCVLLPRRNR